MQRDRHHIGKRGIEYNYATAIVEKMGKHGKAECNEYRLLSTFGEFVIIKQFIIAGDIHIQLIDFSKFGGNLAIGDNAEIVSKKICRVLHWIVVDIFFLHLKYLGDMKPIGKKQF